MHPTQQDQQPWAPAENYTGGQSLKAIFPSKAPPIFQNKYWPFEGSFYT